MGGAGGSGTSRIGFVEPLESSFAGRGPAWIGSILRIFGFVIVTIDCVHEFGTKAEP